MNEKQKDSIAKYLYDLSKAIHVGWLIGLSTDKISWQFTILLASLAVELLYFAYRLEAKDDRL